MEDSDSSVLESSEESTDARRPIRIYCILHGKCSHSTDNCKDLRAMVNKHKQKKKKPFKYYEKSNKELNALIERKFQKLQKTRKGGKQRSSFSIFKKCRFQMTKARKASPAWQKAWKLEKSHPPGLNEKWARTKYLLHV